MQVPVRLIEREKGSALLCVNLVVCRFQCDTRLLPHFDWSYVPQGSVVS